MNPALPELPPPRGDARPAIVAIDGPSGSGKTELARLLAAQHPCRVGAVVHMDDIYPGWQGLDQAPGLVTSWVLVPLWNREPATFRRWDWYRSSRGDEITIAPSEVVIVEGVGSGATVCAPYLSCLIFLDADETTRKQRALARDGGTFAPHWETWAAQEHAHFRAENTRSRATCIIET